MTIGVRTPAFACERPDRAAGLRIEGVDAGPSLPKNTRPPATVGSARAVVASGKSERPFQRQLRRLVGRQAGAPAPTGTGRCSVEAPSRSRSQPRPTRRMAAPPCSGPCRTWWRAPTMRPARYSATARFRPRSARRPAGASRPPSAPSRSLRASAPQRLDGRNAADRRWRGTRRRPSRTARGRWAPAPGGAWCGHNSSATKVIM